MVQGANQEWANVIVDKEDRFKERIAGTLTAMSQREVVIDLALSEQKDWIYFGWFRHEREKKLRDLQDVLIEADRLSQRMKKRRAQRRGTQQQKSVRPDNWPEWPFLAE
jgi:hypothetical protein